MNNESNRMYMEGTHSRNVGIAKFVNECLYDTKNPMQLQNPNIRNTVNGFPCIMYINDELQGIYNFNLDRYSTKSFGYTDEDKVLVYEISANSDTTAGAFYSWNENSGKDEVSYYKSDFECLYPPTRAAGNDSLTELKRLIEWVDKSSDEDFKDNIGRYFNLEYLLRYYLNVLVFGLVDSLGKNAKLASFDSGLTWYFQFYDADTSLGLNNSGFLLFDADIEMGDQNVFNTTGSRLWQRVVYLFDAELKAQYALMRQDRYTVDNIMKYIYGEQISRIPATYYNKDMQTKYLDFGSSYLYALHGSSENQIRKWVRERIMYVDTLLGYMVTSSDYITIRANKLGPVHLDIEMYQPMYVSVKFRDEANNAGMVTKRVGKGEKVRFEYVLPTETDQEILVYCGKNIKSLGDLSNLQPSTMLIANANRLTSIEVHSPNLINTDLSECKMLQRIDISNCTALGTGIGAQPILNIQNCKYLRYLDCSNTQITSIYTMASGSNLEEIYYPQSIQSISLSNQAYLKVIGIPYETDSEGNVTKYCENLADIEINNCRYVDYMHYPYKEGDYVNLDSIKQVQNFTLITSLDKLTGMNFRGFSKLKNLKLSSMHNIKSLGFDDMLPTLDPPTLETITVSDCPLIDTVSFNLSGSDHKVEFVEGAVIDLGGVQSVKNIESNASIKGLKTMIIPTSTKQLRFTTDYGDGINDIKNIWSAAAEHTLDGFTGIDLLDINLTYLDMGKLSKINNGINFHISPTTQHPNMNTFRTENYFRPEGSITLDDYTGSMVSMLKGVDLSKLDVILTKNKSQDDLTGLLSGSVIPSDKLSVVNYVLSKYNMSTNWTNLFKDAELGFESDEIIIPDKSSYRDMDLTGMFNGTNVSRDIPIGSNIISVNEMFKNCKNMRTYLKNWEKSYRSDLITDECYTNTGGNLELVPVPWGGYGFFDDVTTEIIVKITKADFEMTIANKYKTIDFGMINWGDGTIDCLFDNNYKHVYKSPGVYTIKGHFTFGKGYICNTSLNSTLIEVKRIAGETKDLNQAFKYCANLTKVNLNGLKPTNLSELFSGCSNLSEIIMDTLDTSNVTNMNNTFYKCQALESLDLSNWNTGKVTNMTGIFYYCNRLTSLDLTNWNTEKVKKMGAMFQDCKGLTDLYVGDFNMGNVNELNSMFNGCYNLTTINGIEGWDVSSATTMENMFYGCGNLLSLNLNEWDTSAVTNMKSLFHTCSKLSEVVLDQWDVSSVTIMSGMFNNCSALPNINVSRWETTEVTDMSYMFGNCDKLTSLDLSSWDVSKVTTMSNMFYGCDLLTTVGNISNWKTDLLANVGSLFSGCVNIPSMDLTNWNMENVTDMNSLFYDCNKITTIKLGKWNTSKVTNMSFIFSNCNSLITLEGIEHWDTSAVNTMASMFSNCVNIHELKITNFVTNNVTSMNNMFYGCKMISELNLSGFNTSNVTDLGGMFYNCNNLLNLNISNWDTKKVTNMNSIFYGCNSLPSLDLSHFNTQNLLSMYRLFYGCNTMTELILTGWTTSKVNNMSGLFSGCTNLINLDVSGFNTSNVTDMSNMFYGCNKLLSLDLSKFNTVNVTSMSNMFNGCGSLEELNIDHFSTNKVTTMTNMFNGCKCDIKFTNKSNDKLKTVFAMFNVYYGSSIDLSNFSLNSSTNNENFVTIANNLVDFKAPINIKSDIKITATGLSVESLLSIINNLATVTTNKTLEIGSTNLAKLTDEQIAIAVAKNWTVC